MTTIAFKDGVLAYDSQTTGDWKPPFTYEKVAKVPEEFGGGYFAMTGDINQCQKVVDAFLACGTLDKVTIDLRDAGRVVWLKDAHNAIIIEGVHYYAIKIEEFGAWGSGCPVAWGALAAGASAAEAVEIAARFDPGTGGEIKEVRIF